MYTTIRFDVPDECEPLGIGLGPPVGASVLLERTVACGGAPEHTVWVFNATGDTVGRNLQRSDSIGEVTALATGDETEGGRCYRVRWNGPPGGVFAPLRSASAMLLEAVRSEGRWRFTARVPTDELGRLRERCQRRGLRTEIRTIDRGPVRRHGDDDRAVWSQLTEPQSEALGVAFERGYFEVPRRTSLQEVAAELGVSDSAASQRLRRGLATLLRVTTGVDAGRDRISAD